MLVLVSFFCFLVFLMVGLFLGCAGSHFIMLAFLMRRRLGVSWRRGQGVVCFFVMVGVAIAAHMHSLTTHCFSLCCSLFVSPHVPQWKSCRSSRRCRRRTTRGGRRGQSLLLHDGRGVRSLGCCQNELGRARLWECWISYGGFSYRLAVVDMLAFNLGFKFFRLCASTMGRAVASSSGFGKRPHVLPGSFVAIAVNRWRC